MTKTFFTVGPSQLFPTVPQHIQTALADDVMSWSHRGSQFKDLYRATTDGLRQLLKVPAEHQIFFIGSATEGMARIIENCVQNRSAHLITGAFGERFYQIAGELQKNPVKQAAAAGEGIDLDQSETDADTELICLTQNDTSTGVMLDPAAIGRLKRRHPDKLVAVDIVSSVPYVDIDYAQTDATVFSVQKGFGLPAGLGVLIVSPAALAKASDLADRKQMIGSHHSFLDLHKHAQNHQTPATPNILAIYLLRHVLKDLQAIGIQTVRDETDAKAKLVYDFAEANSKFQPFVRSPEARSKTTITLSVQGGSKPVIEQLAAQGLIVGSGYGSYKDDQIRIANFPAHSLADIENLIAHLKQC